MKTLKDANLMIEYFKYIRMTKIKIKIMITMSKNNKYLLQNKGLLQYCKRKFSSEIRFLLCPVNLQKARLCFTDMRILQLINTCNNN